MPVCALAMFESVDSDWHPWFLLRLIDADARWIEQGFTPRECWEYRHNVRRCHEKTHLSCRAVADKDTSCQVGRCWQVNSPMQATNYQLRPLQQSLYSPTSETGKTIGCQHRVTKLTAKCCTGMQFGHHFANGRPAPRTSGDNQMQIHSENTDIKAA